MPITRRSMIVAAGGALVLAGSAGVWRVTRSPRTATAPWAFDPAPLPDVRLDAFRYAILAPNPHNRQPWLIRMDGGDGATLFCDLERRLPQTDPFDRQITIGFGAFLELARMAAAERGNRLEISLFPQGEALPRLDARPIASLRFIPDAKVARDPLFAHIRRRRSNKEAFDKARALKSDAVAAIAEQDDRYMIDPAIIAQARAIILRAVSIEATTRRTHLESINLLRIGHAEIDAAPDGIDLGGPAMEALKLVGQLDRATLADPGSMASQAALDGMLDSYGSIPGLIWVATPGNSRADQIEAGRRYVRANLRATALGLAMHPMSQSLQEYAEVAQPFAAIHGLLEGQSGRRVQMLARIGYGSPTDPAPRWPLETRVRTH